MKFNNGLVLSAAALAVLTTGCVKKPTNDESVVYGNPQTVYDNPQSGTVYGSTTTTSTPIYEEAAPIVYETEGTTYGTPVGTTYGTPVESTVITTTNTYGQPTTAGGAFGQPVSGSTGSYDPYAVSNTTYPDPYGSTGSSSSSSNTYSTNNSYGSSSSSSQGGGIHLQVAALKDYYAAEEFKNSLSLDPKYSAYVKRGAMNKVIVSGISSVSEVNRLKETRFPGAFVVSGSATASSTHSSGGYTSNNSYGGNTSSAGNSNGIGVQIGAFSSKSKAQGVANSASSKYRGTVKSGKSNGRTIYKAILTGFNSEQEARSFIANRGTGFLVHGI